MPKRSERLGLECPMCGYFQTDIKDTRDKGDGVIRLRVCLNCGHEFRTVESTGKPKDITKSMRPRKSKSNAKR